MDARPTEVWAKDWQLLTVGTVEHGPTWPSTGKRGGGSSQLLMPFPRLAHTTLQWTCWHCECRSAGFEPPGFSTWQPACGLQRSSTASSKKCSSENWTEFALLGSRTCVTWKRYALYVAP
eukprot:SAG11_NODE_7211_length_1177_cov_1.392393_1_plen_119_part_10